MPAPPRALIAPAPVEIEGEGHDEPALAGERREMAGLIRSHPSPSTPLSALDTWPPTLRELVDGMLSSPQAICVACGEALTCVFNDADVALLGQTPRGAPGLPLSRLPAARGHELGPRGHEGLGGHGQLRELPPIAPAGQGAALPSSVCVSRAPTFGEGAAVPGLHCVALQGPEGTRGAPERALREPARHGGEDRYRAVFAAIDEGFCILEVLFDEQGRARNNRFLEANDAFERHIGLRGVLGRTMREFAPEHEEWRFEV